MEQAISHPTDRAAAAPTRTNWAGNYTFEAAHWTAPSDVDDLGQTLRSADAVKAVGTRHSFNHLADTTGTQVLSSHLKEMTLHAEERAVTVGAGVTYGELAPFLDAHGFALHNLASLPHISVVGACSTGTHGSGLRNGCLSTAVRAIELMRANGERLLLDRERDAEVFPYAVVGLGALGVITAVTVDVVPRFDVAQTVYEDLNFEELRGNLRPIFDAGYSVSLFTDWQEHRATQVWLKQKVNPSDVREAPEEFFGATRQRTKLHPLPNMSAENCTEQEGKPGPWYERLPHFRLDYTPSAGAELQTEYFVNIDDGYAALSAVETLRDQITPHLLVSELRTIAADRLPMSMCYERESLALHFTWKQDMEAVLALLPVIEAKLEPFRARPHWAKLFTVAPAHMRTLYPKLEQFLQVTRQFDPEGKFQNRYLRELFR